MSTQSPKRKITPRVPGDGLEGLQAERDQQAARAGELDGKAGLARAAAAQLEADRLQALERDEDTTVIRARKREAEDQAQDETDRAAIARARVQDLDTRIADLAARQDFTRMREELATVVQATDAVCASTGERQRASIAGLRAAAEEFTAAIRDELAAISRRTDLAAAVTAAAVHLGETGPDIPVPVSTALSVHPDLQTTGGPLALARAINEAHAGNTERVALRLAEAFGWTPPGPPSPEEVAAWQERQAQMRAQQTGPPPAPAQVMLGPGDEASVGVDANGRPVRWQPVPPHPQDVYRGGGFPWPPG